MQHPAEHSPLGKTSEYVSSYTPSLLFPISRTAKWAELGLSAETLPYRGVDIWNCYELSWLTPAGDRRVLDPGGLAEHHRVEVVQALPQFPQPVRLR